MEREFRIPELQVELIYVRETYALTEAVTIVNANTETGIRTFRPTQGIRVAEDASYLDPDDVQLRIRRPKAQVFSGAATGTTEALWLEPTLEGITYGGVTMLPHELEKVVTLQADCSEGGDWDDGDDEDSITASFQHETDGRCRPVPPSRGDRTLVLDVYEGTAQPAMSISLETEMTHFNGPLIDFDSSPSDELLGISRHTFVPCDEDLEPSLTYVIQICAAPPVSPAGNKTKPDRIPSNAVRQRKRSRPQVSSLRYRQSEMTPIDACLLASDPPLRWTDLVTRPPGRLKEIDNPPSVLPTLSVEATRETKVVTLVAETTAASESATVVSDEPAVPEEDGMLYPDNEAGLVRELPHLDEAPSGASRNAEGGSAALLSESDIGLEIACDAPLEQPRPTPIFQTELTVSCPGDADDIFQPICDGSPIFCEPTAGTGDELARAPLETEVTSLPRLTSPLDPALSMPRTIPQEDEAVTTVMVSEQVQSMLSESEVSDYTRPDHGGSTTGEVETVAANITSPGIEPSDVLKSSSTPIVLGTGCAEVDPVSNRAATPPATFGMVPLIPGESDLAGDWSRLGSSPELERAVASPDPSSGVQPEIPTSSCGPRGIGPVILAPSTSAGKSASAASQRATPPPAVVSIPSPFGGAPPDEAACFDILQAIASINAFCEQRAAEIGACAHEPRTTIETPKPEFTSLVETVGFVPQGAVSETTQAHATEDMQALGFSDNTWLSDTVLDTPLEWAAIPIDEQERTGNPARGSSVQGRNLALTDPADSTGLARTEKASRARNQATRVLLLSQWGMDRLSAERSSEHLDRRAVVRDDSREMRQDGARMLGRGYRCPPVAPVPRVRAPVLAHSTYREYRPKSEIGDRRAPGHYNSEALIRAVESARRPSKASLSLDGKRVDQTGRNGPGPGLLRQKQQRLGDIPMWTAQPGAQVRERERTSKEPGRRDIGRQRRDRSDRSASPAAAVLPGRFLVEPDGHLRAGSKHAGRTSRSSVALPHGMPPARRKYVSNERDGQNNRNGQGKQGRVRVVDLTEEITDEGSDRHSGAWRGSGNKRRRVTSRSEASQVEVEVIDLTSD